MLMVKEKEETASTEGHTLEGTSTSQTVYGEDRDDAGSSERQRDSHNTQTVCLK